MIFTFSTKGTRPQDTETVERVKQMCDDKGLVFSSVVLKQLAKWEKENG